MPSIEPGRLVTTAAAKLPGTLFSRAAQAKDRRFVFPDLKRLVRCSSRRPAAGVILLLEACARSTTFRLMSETPAPVSIAKTNGPAPLIQPLANKPAIAFVAKTNRGYGMARDS